jgi:predicted phage terminase large subunit-like protein
MKVRTEVNEWGPYYGLRVSDQSAAKDQWELAELQSSRLTNGGMITAGIGTAITGRGADLLCIDDPLKDSEEANSQTTREAHKDWYRSTAYTRLEPQAVIVLVLTRWHEDDLAGFLLQEAKELGEKWEVLNLPALAEENDELGRQPGEALWPERFPLSRLEQIRDQVGPYWWASMYEQRPAPLEGGLFKHSLFKYFEIDPEKGMYKLRQSDGGIKLLSVGEGRRIMTVDLATSERESADYTVCALGVVTPDNDLLVEEVFRARVPGHELVSTIEAKYRAWKPDALSVESRGFQLSVVQMLARRGLPVRRLEAKGDKLARALPLAARFESGNVYFRKGAPFLTYTEPELLGFPNATHDDVVDALAYLGLDLVHFGGSDWHRAYGIVRCAKCEHAYVAMPPGAEHQQVCPRCGTPPLSLVS